MRSDLLAVPFLTLIPPTHHSVLAEDSKRAQRCGRRVPPATSANPGFTHKIYPLDIIQGISCGEHVLYLVGTRTHKIYVPTRYNMFDCYPLDIPTR